jgi:hypothetical protein
MEIATKKLGRLLLTLGLIAFLVVAFFGASKSMSMEMRDDGTMGGCLFTGMDAICTMKLEEHLTQWQSMFTTTDPQKALTFVLLILLAVVFVTVSIFKRNLLLLFSYYTTRWRLYIKHNPALSLFNSLREAFSQGILNPKIY